MTLSVSQVSIVAGLWRAGKNSAEALHALGEDGTAAAVEDLYKRLNAARVREEQVTERQLAAQQRKQAQHAAMAKKVDENPYLTRLRQAAQRPVRSSKPLEEDAS